jgi:hypothetical protein
MSTLTSNDTKSRYIFYHKDGLLDLFIGFAIFFAGLFLWTEMVWMAGIFIPVFLPSFQSARQRFLQPRIDKPSYSPRQQAQTQKLFFFMALLSLGMLLAGIGMLFVFGLMSGSANDWIRQYFLFTIGIIFAGAWIFAGAMLKINRFYLYAAFTFGTLSFAQFTVLPFWVALAILGGSICLVGLMVLIRFVQLYPIKD